MHHLTYRHALEQHAFPFGRSPPSMLCHPYSLHSQVAQRKLTKYHCPLLSASSQANQPAQGLAAG